MISPSLFWNFIEPFLYKDMERDMCKIKVNTIDLYHALREDPNRNGLFVKDICCAKQFTLPCICFQNFGQRDQRVDCQLCEKSKNEIGYEQIYGIISTLLKQNGVKIHKGFDCEWVKNAYQHIVWKLSSLRHM